MKSIFLIIFSLVLLTCHKPLPVPEPVTLSIPLNEMVLRQKLVEFQWQEKVDAVGYNIQIDKKNSFSHPIIDSTVTDTAFAIELADGNYFWRVRVLSKDSVWGEWSETWSFMIERYRIISQTQTYGYAHDVFVREPYAYIADGQAGLTVLNIEDSQEPVIAANIMDTTNEAWGVAVENHYAYIAYGSYELQIVDISELDTLRFFGSLYHPTPAFGYDIVVENNLAYIAALSQFLIVDVSDPLYPRQLYQRVFPANVRGVAIFDTFAIIACEQLGIYIYDLRHTTQPEIVGWCDTPGNARDVFISDSFAFVADGTGGIVVINIKDKTNPQIISRLDLPGYARKIYMVDNLLYIALGDSGLGVVDINNPNEPKIDAIMKIGGYAYSVFVLDDYIYIAHGRSGLTIVAKEEEK
ncbi:MAG: hypothetical protein OEW70_02155 [candidate division WOR-3 bacterium]|nr:hypothetical protein [candidate division WOR-3 bacterium]